MPEVWFGRKDEPSTKFVQSNELVVVRTRSAPSTLSPPALEALKAGVKSEAPVLSFPEANVDVYGLGTADAAAVDVAKSALGALDRVRFAGRVLVMEGSGEPVVYTENLFVKFADQLSDKECIEVLGQRGLQVKRKLEYAQNSYFVSTQEGTGQKVFDIAKDLLSRDDVEYCHPEIIRRRARKTIYPDQWHLRDATIGGKKIKAHANVEAAHKLTRGKGVVIAVIDDGFDIGHPEFNAPDKIVAPRDATMHTHDPNPKDLDPEAPDNHGTACAGVACASGVHGCSGVAPEARLMPIRLASQLGSQDEADAFYWAARNGADVISCSWGPEDGIWWEPKDPRHTTRQDLPGSTRLAIDYATRAGRGGKGCVVLFAAGNGGESVEYDGYASYEKVIAVAASNDRGVRSIYSDYGPAIWCAFPSGDASRRLPAGRPLPLTRGIWTTDRRGKAGYNIGDTKLGDETGDYAATFSGTSSACPGVAGVVALMLSTNPELTRAEVKALLAASCEKIDPAEGQYDSNGWSPLYGHGRINAELAVKAAIRSAEAARAAGAVRNAPPAVPIAAPTRPLRAARDYSTAKCKIFPPIGIARIGDSDDAWFIGPEAPGVVPEVASYKDKLGRVARQAARFRVFAYFPDGSVEELDAEHADVARLDWTVTLANKKAAWHQFGGAKTVAAILKGDSRSKRNQTVTGTDREKLEITPPAATVSGSNSRSAPLLGSFQIPGSAARSVKLGELMTDSAGRLLVLGGHGVADTVVDDNPLYHYANNDGWYDDTSDGPVHARVQINGGPLLEATGAWVVVAPPHYSPHTPNVVTLYDAMAEAAVKHKLDWNEAELGPKPAMQTSFTHDIYPVISRLGRLPWISGKAHRGHGPGKRASYDDAESLKLLSDRDAATKHTSLHKRFVSRLRTPTVRPLYDDAEPFKVAIDPQSQDAIQQATLYYMPALSGDEGTAEHGNPESWFTLTEMQYHHFRKWSQGDFTNDWKGPPEAVSLERMLVADRPQALTRAALEMGQGGAFFPGIEITSIVRYRGFYDAEAFRVSTALKAGDLSKWMALPWQADFFECSENWWPTVRPDEVIPGSEFDIIREKEATREDLRPLLIARQPWVRGLELEVPFRPDIPAPNDSESLDAYYARLQGWTARVFKPALERYLPVPIEHELADVFRQRIEEFLARAFRLSPDLLKGVPRGGSLAAYRAAVRQHLESSFSELLTPPIPMDPKLTAVQYFETLRKDEGHRKGWRNSSVLQGHLDLEWRRRFYNRGKNDLRARWSKLGFVRLASHTAGEVLVERDRPAYEMLSSREYFHILTNIEAHPEFLPKAKSLGREYFDKGREVERDVVANDPTMWRYRYFDFDPITFQARLDEIYEEEKRVAEASNPVLAAEGESMFRTPERIMERIRQLAPFNQLDGSWLERIAKAGPIDDVQSFLFEIWSDEIGGGDPTKNHANIYTDLMHAAGIYLPPLNSRAFAFHPDLWESSFVSPAYQSAAALFPETFYPELLGMTLYLEWEAIYLPAIVKLYKYFGYPSLFYELHVAIDNPVNGHGARARDAVLRYLNDIRVKGGEQEMQDHWRRVWDGYLAFKFVGSDEWLYRFTNPLTLDERMVDMVRSKRRYGQLNHADRRFAGNLLNDWFDQPEEFLAAMAASELIVRGDPERSAFFRVVGQNGPMLKVFTDKELGLWREWIAAMPRDPVLQTDAATHMLELLKQLSARGSSTPGHGDYRLKGAFRDPAKGDALADVDMPVGWWFSIDQPDRLMEALARPENGLVNPGAPEQSRLVREFVVGERPMAGFLSQVVPELGEVTGAEVIVRWIRENCPLPAPKSVGAMASRLMLMRGRIPGRSRAEVEDSDPRVVQATLSSVAPVATPPSRLRRSGPGGGAAH